MDLEKQEDSYSVTMRGGELMGSLWLPAWSEVLSITCEVRPYLKVLFNGDLRRFSYWFPYLHLNSTAELLLLTDIPKLGPVCAGC
jgi:hypothetical protein